MFKRLFLKFVLPAPLALALMLIMGGAAQSSPSDIPASLKSSAPSSVSLRYAVYIHGFHILDADGSYALRPWGYGGTARLHTVGLASWFLTIDVTAKTAGHFDGGKIQPLEYDARGYSRGEQRHAHWIYDENGPHLTILKPRDDDRDPLDPALLKPSLDILSGLGLLFHSLEMTGKCDLSGTIFDGLRLTQIDVHGPVSDMIPNEYDNYYKGTAERCDFVGKQVGGFVKNSHHRDLLSAPHPGKAWFRHIENIGIVPVRIDFQHPKIGQIIMVMQTPPNKADVEIDPTIKKTIESH